MVLSKILDITHADFTQKKKKMYMHNYLCMYIYRHMLIYEEQHRLSHIIINN